MPTRIARAYMKGRDLQTVLGAGAEALRGDIDALGRRVTDHMEDAAVAAGARVVRRSARSAARRAGERTRHAARDLRTASSIGAGVSALGSVVRHGARAGAFHTAALAARAAPHVVTGARIAKRAGRNVGAAVRDGVLAAGDAMASRATARTAPRPARARSASPSLRGR
jgi:hypothetical protein